MSWLEIVAVILGVLCVGLTIRQNIWCWPVGLAMVTLYVFIFYDAKLYSDMLLQIVYIGLQIYGWHAWLRGGPQNHALPVSLVTQKQILLWALTCVVLTAGLGSAMHFNTDASFPFVDAFTTVASLIAQWLMGRKKLHSWFVWIVVDVVSIGLYLAKSLYLTAGLYVVFLMMATLGYFAWRKSYLVAASG